MTREHKLALIVGFSLVLLVGVLIADHLSLARRASIAPVGKGELTVAVAPGPLQGSEGLLLGQDRVPILVPPVVQEPGPAGTQPPAPITFNPVSTAAAAPESNPNPAPVEDVLRIDQSRPQPRVVGTDGDWQLAQQIRALGGEISAAGEILLPPQAETVHRGSDARPEALTTAPPAPAPTSTVRPASPAPLQAPAAATAATRSHTVQRGDTYFKIADRYYGSGHLWPQLAKFNGSPSDGRVVLGSSIRLPAKEVLTGRQTPAGGVASPSPARPARPESTPAKPKRTELAMTYTVRRGDTLGEISQKTLGTSRRWREIAEFNKLKDEDHIPAGTVLKLPPMRG